MIDCLVNDEIFICYCQVRKEISIEMTSSFFSYLETIDHVSLTFYSSRGTTRQQAYSFEKMISFEVLFLIKDDVQ